MDSVGLEFGGQGFSLEQWRWGGPVDHVDVFHGSQVQLALKPAGVASGLPDVGVFEGRTDHKLGFSLVFLQKGSEVLDILFLGPVVGSTIVDPSSDDDQVEIGRVQLIGADFLEQGAERASGLDDANATFNTLDVATLAVGG